MSGFGLIVVFIVAFFEVISLGCTKAKPGFWILDGSAKAKDKQWRSRRSVPAITVMATL